MYEKLSYAILKALPLISGDYSEEDTPVPIPNTEVKLFSADDTWRETARESRSSPGFFIFCFLRLNKSA